MRIRQLIFKSFLFAYLCCFNTAVGAMWFTETRAVMGTEVSLMFWHEEQQTGARAIEQVFAEMQRIDRTYSPYKTNSDLSVVNRTAYEQPQVISAEFAQLVDKALYFNRLTNGAFDITFAALGQHYDYRQGKQPSAAERALALSGMGGDKLIFDRSLRTLQFQNAQVKIDLGGIAKGFAVDRAAGLLQSLGVKHATISAGGDSYVLGDKLGAPWVIGIKNPRKQDAQSPETVIRLPLTNVAVSTSGDYERFFIEPKTGERIHHILNPRTATSARDVMSVTVIGPRGVDTDALSTSLFILGVEKGLALINGLAGFDAIFIDANGKVHYSAELAAPEG